MYAIVECNFRNAQDSRGSRGTSLFKIVDHKRLAQFRWQSIQKRMHVLLPGEVTCRIGYVNRVGQSFFLISLC